jgi:tetratricopeptide (TPR) repeat protein
MWSRRSIEVLLGVSLLAAMAACTVTPKRSAQAARTAAAAAHPAAGKPAPAAPPPVPAEAREEFDQALALARGGNDAAAEARLTALAGRYTQFHTPLVDLGILYRKDGNLDAAVKALRQALARAPHSARAWTELGVTQRLAGRFQDAERSYGRAIAANAGYAPAYRDRGVLRDLYLGQPAAALGDFERYRELTGQKMPVAMWIAELQHRTGIKEPPAGEPPATAASASSRSPAPAAGASPPSPAPAGTAPAPRHETRN